MSNIIKVLLVDDEEKFRETTRKILNRRGFDAIVAGGGEEALEKLAEAPEVVVLDVKMPGMDGHQVLREIKKCRPDLPVIMLTGHGAMPSAKEALEHGAFDYLAKPCNIDLLTSKIIDAFRSRTAVDETDEKRVGEVMIPIEEYTTIKENDTIKTAVAALKESFSAKISTSRLMETGHRSVLVFNDAAELTGVVAITDLMSGIMPPYLSAPLPSLADSVRYSPMFWHGMFTQQVKQVAAKKVKDLMQPAPRTIRADANLMEAAYTMLNNGDRRLIVRQKGRIVGVIREQELFFEIEKILLR